MNRKLIYYISHSLPIHQGLGLIPPEEWDTFMAIMRESLPATFRITGTRLLAEQLRTCLEKKFFGHLSQIEVEGEAVPPPKPLTWYAYSKYKITCL